MSDEQALRDFMRWCSKASNAGGPNEARFPYGEVSYWVERYLRERPRG